MQNYNPNSNYNPNYNPNSEYPYQQTPYYTEDISHEEIERRRQEALKLTAEAHLVPIGKIIFTCPDPYYFRVLVEIMSDLTHTGKLRFYNDGVCLPHTNKEQNVSVVFMLPEKTAFLDYQRVFLPGYEEEIKQYTTSRIILKKAANTFGSYEKKISMSVMGDIYSGDSVINLISEGHGQCGYDRIPCDNQTEDLDQNDNIDLLGTYYPNTNPTCKMTLNKLSILLNKYKKIGCDTLTFTLIDQKKIRIKAIKNGIEESISDCDSKGQITDVAENPNSFSEVKIGGMILAISDYSISINYIKCNPWMTKIVRLAHGNSLVEMYMEPNKPLIISTFISTMGRSYFAFKHDTGLIGMSGYPL